MDKVLASALVPLIVLLLTIGHVGAQDIHYSQFYNAPEILNPALTGIFYGDVRMMGHFRRQWENVPVDYLTFSGTYDMKVYPKKAKGNDFVGLGLNFNYDNTGFSKLTLAQLQLGGSYSKELAKNAFLTGGLQLGFSNRSFKEGDLTFDSQFDPIRNMYDPSLATGENFDKTSKFYPDLSIGANLRLQKDDRRTKLDFGVAMYHLNTPKQEFFESGGQKLPARFAIYGIGAMKLAGPLDLLLRATAQLQSKYREYVPGAALKIHLNQNRGKELAFQVGANFRVNEFTDAITPAVELHYKTLSVGYSYDINVSDFQIATDDKGGPEIWVAYRIVKVKPLSQFKTCPIF